MGMLSVLQLPFVVRSVQVGVRLIRVCCSGSSFSSFLIIIAGSNYALVDLQVEVFVNIARRVDFAYIRRIQVAVFLLVKHALVRTQIEAFINDTAVVLVELCLLQVLIRIIDVSLLVELDL